MATHIDNSKDMSASDISNILINTFKRSAEKSVNDANYDKTILATIQYCTDATIGQYKIKYQNGYFTAYSQNKDIVYANKATVFVLVPGNDMNNRLFITGLATNNSGDRISLTNLEGDQAYGVTGAEFITQCDDINMQSYWTKTAEGYVRVLYKHDIPSSWTNYQNCITLVSDEEIRQTISNTDGYFRLGANFRTAFREDQKNVEAADYGIRIKIKYNNIENDDGCKIYELTTFNMQGAPFEFTNYVPQYLYWDIDKENFAYIESIEEFMIGFNSEPSSPVSVDFRDIFIKNLSIKAANKLYDINNDLYVASIEAGHLAFVDDEQSIELIGHLYYRGNEIKDDSQNLQYFWGKEDASVDNVKNKRYNQHLGPGWYCLNEATRNVYKRGQTVDDLKKHPGISNTDTINEDQNTYTWRTDEKKINLPKSLCLGKTTNIKLVIVYEHGEYESAILKFSNYDGLYLTFQTDFSNGGDTIINGKGYFNITAGLFKDNYDREEETPVPENFTFGGIDKDGNHFNVEYVWKEINSFGFTRNIPDLISSNILLNGVNWSPKNEHNEHIDDEYVENPQWGEEGNETCIERYDYYNTAYNRYIRMTAEEQGQLENPDYNTRITRCQDRKNSIITKRTTEISAKYTADSNNSLGYYITGPSAVTGKYNNGIYSNVSTTIDTIENYFYGTPEYESHKNNLNTLYKVSGSNIQKYATYVVSAIKVPDRGVRQAIETKTVLVTNSDGNGLDYDLEIVNGKQSFLYDEAGFAPTSDKSSSSIYLKPLFFKLYNKDGALLFDSQKPDEGDTNIAELKPRWSLYRNEYSLLRTDYEGNESCEIDAGDGTRINVKNESKLVYDLNDRFDINKSNESNITLQVHYNGETISASTNFTFVKQGEIGTNGTDLYLQISDNQYDSYKDSILNIDKYNKFNASSNSNIEYYDYAGPNQRHLKNGYLYATHCFDSPNLESTDVNSARYVNLFFAQRANSNIDEGSIDDGLAGNDTSATLTGYWQENGQTSVIDADSVWSTEITDGYDTKGELFYCTPSFRVLNEIGSNTQIKINYLNDQPPYALKPTTIFDYSPRPGVTCKRTANNIVRVKSSTYSNIVDPVSGANIKTTSYGYYSVPYFYFAKYIKQGQEWKNVTAANTDPARHIVITGGFDEVEYDSAGRNPVYDKQKPFKVYLFDENFNDISKIGNAIWTASQGFTLKTVVPSVILPYYSISYNTSLYGVYCRYTDGKVYKCIKDHTRGNKVTLSDGRVLDPAIAMVRPYWIEANVQGNLEATVSPYDTYESLASLNLLNSWISVHISATVNDNTRYEGEALIPINVISNRYGSKTINGWDGKKAKIGDSYMIANSVIAGVKDNDNDFIGVTIGQSAFMEDKDRENEIGVMGYGRPNNTSNPNDWARTFFMDARTGRLVLGPSGASQIVLNPYIPPQGSWKQSWSRLAGWYFSPDYLYKPIGEGDEPLDNKAFTKYEIIEPSDTSDGSAGIYAPYHGTVEAGDVFMWASAKQKDVGLPDIKKQIDKYKQQLSGYNVIYDDSGHIANENVIENQYNKQMAKAEAELDIYYCFLREIYPLKPTPYPYDSLPLDTKALVSRAEYQEMVTNILEHYPEDWTSSELPPSVEEYIEQEIEQKNIEKVEIVTEKNAFNELCAKYEKVWNQYDNVINSESNGAIVHWNTGNKKVANFYVTYGGHLHAESADITGSITALSGTFGTGSNKISIATTVNAEKYILYNKNFWVKDRTSSEGGPEVYIQGTIEAKSGIIGRTRINGKKTTGDNSDSLFIQYSWYPWRLPKDTEPWNEDTYYLNRNAGRNVKYVLYHKNFYIKQDGDSLFRGTLYAEKGRIGNWVINNNDLKSYNSNIVLHPGNDNDNGYITLGGRGVKLNDDGRLDGPTINGDIQWYITETGEAHFSNLGNEFTGSKFTCGSGASAVTLDGRGLILPAGKDMKIGDETLHAFESGEGFSFSGKTTFEDNISLSAGKNINLSGGQISFATGTGGLTVSQNGLSYQGAYGQGTFKLDNTGLTIGSGSDALRINESGQMSNVKFNNADSLQINGQSLDEYIKGQVQSYLRGKILSMVDPDIRPIDSATNVVVGLSYEFFDPQ